MARNEKQTEPQAPEAQALEAPVVAPRNIREALEAQPKVRVRLYQAPEGQPQLSDVMVGVNGYNYLIKRGESVEVPETVAEILSQAGHI